MGFMDQFSSRHQQPQQSATPQPQVPQQQMMQVLGSRLNSIKQAANGDASGFINYMKQTNPDFAAFAQSMQGKTPEQAFSEFGLDYSQFSGIL